MQLKELIRNIDKLQAIYGDPILKSIYGAGCIKNPKVMFIFMNPTARNISAYKNWKGLKAPWLGAKDIWHFFYAIGFLSKKSFQEIYGLKPDNWTYDFSTKIYKEISKNKGYITNLAKCTQLDARPLKNEVFKEYLDIMMREITLTNPKHIITFGNQVSSILLNKQISISEYRGVKKEILKIGSKNFYVFPVYYPVGQGRRNLPLAIKRIKKILIE